MIHETILFVSTLQIQHEMIMAAVMHISVVAGLTAFIDSGIDYS